MRISAAEHASQLRMSKVKAEVARLLMGLVEEMPDVTYVEIAVALLETAERNLMHQRRAETENDALPTL